MDSFERLHQSRRHDVLRAREILAGRGYSDIHIKWPKPPHPFVILSCGRVHMSLVWNWGKNGDSYEVVARVGEWQKKRPGKQSRGSGCGDTKVARFIADRMQGFLKNPRNSMPEPGPLDAPRDFSPSYSAVH